jgi:hypothetical protein
MLGNRRRGVRGGFLRHRHRLPLRYSFGLGFPAFHPAP